MAIYRGLTVQFTAASSTSAINFADGGLQGVSDESWGIDNVSVSQGVTTVFSDNFESGSANAAWAVNAVDASTPGVFTDFLGRFSNNGDTLNLTGLTAGLTYTLQFDLYAIDSLDGQRHHFLRCRQRRHAVVRRGRDERHDRRHQEAQPGDVLLRDQ